MDWRPASRTMDAMTPLAFWAAMRLTSSGVTSRSSNSSYSPVSSSGSPTGTSFVDVDVARLAVDGHPRVPFQVQDALVAFRKRLLQTLDEVELVDLPFMGQRLQGLDQF